MQLIDQAGAVFGSGARAEAACHFSASAAASISWSEKEGDSGGIFMGTELNDCPISVGYRS
ncbi:hypothetical protein [Brevundimonas sp.]|uniref:hypothetical protein n=1 Tax=Brevundimonas sp. TaxID=1871086 RepID=UPI002FC96BA3